MLNGEEQTVKKREKNNGSLVLPHTTISSLPDDLVLSCLARVTRLYYPTLSLVSKKLRSLIASPELYKVRSLLGLTESCLYVCLEFNNSVSDFRWFTLCKRPDTKNNKKHASSSGRGENLLVPIPSHRQGDRAGVVAVGSSIYSIGGLVHNTPSTSVSILDCRSNTWHRAPNMSVARWCAEANVIDRKIYVIGGHLKSDYNSSSWIEVFDPETLIWNSMSSPCGDILGSSFIDSTMVVDGKICMYGGSKGLAYNPKNGICKPIKWIGYSPCVVDNVRFCYSREEKVFKWFDTRARLWKNLKGLEGLMLEISIHTRVKLADYGGKLAVLWEKKHKSSSGHGKKEIWCAVIAVERCDIEEEIWGMLEWSGVVLTVSKSCKFERVVATTL